MWWRQALTMVVLATLVGCGARTNDAAKQPALASPGLAAIIGQIPAPDAGIEAGEMFWQNLRGKVPIIEPVAGNDRECSVTFVFRGDIRTIRVAVVGCPTERLIEPMTRLGLTELWYRTVNVPSVARFSYWFQENGPEVMPSDPDEWERAVRDAPPRSDPLNRHKFAGHAVVDGPQAPPQPWLELRPEGERGLVRIAQVQSTRLGGERAVGLYTPPGFSTGGAAPVPLLVVLGGEYWQGGDRAPGSIPTILDNLIAAGQIPPTVAVLVAAGDEAQSKRDMFGSDD